MSGPMTLNVRVGSAHGEFVAAKVGEGGTDENVSGNIRDLIRRDKIQDEIEVFERLKAELTKAFAVPDSTYQSLDAESVIRRGRMTSRS